MKVGDKVTLRPEGMAQPVEGEIVSVNRAHHWALVRFTFRPKVNMTGWLGRTARPSERRPVTICEGFKIL